MQSRLRKAKVLAATSLCILCFFAAVHVRKRDLNLTLVLNSSRGLNSKPGVIELTEPGVIELTEPGVIELTEPVVIELTAISGQVALISSNGKPVYYSESRGIHVVVISQYTGEIMTHDNFDSYISDTGEMVEFLNTIQNGRLIVFLIADEATRKLQQYSRDLLAKYGSAFIRRLDFRATWVFVCRKGLHARVLHERVTLKNGASRNSSFLNITVQLESLENACKWGDDTVGRSRRKLCSEYCGYGPVCNCTNPAPIEEPPLLDGNKVRIPIAVMASNRPRYLFRMLKGLLATPGVDREMITVFIDGLYDEPEAIAQLYRLSYVTHTIYGVTPHYKLSLTAVFDKFPHAKYVIIFEEDLAVSPDVMDYFKQLIPVLEEDESLFCISASNAHGYRHSCQDSSMLYRFESMPGLGWVLKRKIFKEELEPNWPGRHADMDWDVWIRQSQLKERECVVPDVPRTYHFGVRGLHTDQRSQNMYYQNRMLNLQTGIQFNTSKVIRDNYEMEMHDIIKNGELLDHSKNPCDNKDFVPNTKNHTYVLYILLEHETDYITWLHVARCFDIWHVSIRGMHKRTFRFWMKGNHVIVVGSTSPYAVHKPPDVKPLFIKKWNMHVPDTFH